MSKPKKVIIVVVLVEVVVVVLVVVFVVVFVVDHVVVIIVNHRNLTLKFGQNLFCCCYYCRCHKLNFKVKLKLGH